MRRSVPDVAFTAVVVAVVITDAEEAGRCVSQAVVLAVFPGCMVHVPDCAALTVNAVLSEAIATRGTPAPETPLPVDTAVPITVWLLAALCEMLSCAGTGQTVSSARMAAAHENRRMRYCIPLI